MKPKKLTKAEFIRGVLRDFLHGRLVRVVPEEPICHSFTQIRYQVMTDEHSQKWDVPITEDLRKHDPERWKHTFVRISTDE
jgi:hypothetical protein